MCSANERHRDAVLAMEEALFFSKTYYMKVNKNRTVQLVVNGHEPKRFKIVPENLKNSRYPNTGHGNSTLTWV